MKVDYWREKHADLGLKYDNLIQSFNIAETDAKLWKGTVSTLKAELAQQAQPKPYDTRQFSNLSNQIRGLGGCPSCGKSSCVARQCTQQAQPERAPVDDRWKRASEYWYGEYRHSKTGEAEYPVLGALDAWFNGTFVAIEAAHGIKGGQHD